MPPTLSKTPQFDGRIHLADGILHASTELRGNMRFASWASRMRKEGIELVWHSPAEFDTFLLNLDFATFPQSNPVQDTAVQLLHKAFELKASDIHLVCYATHGSISLRRMGMLEHWKDMGGNELKTLMRAIYQSMTEAGSPRFDPLKRQEGRIVKRHFLPPTVHSVRVHTEPLQTAAGTGLLMTLRLLYDTIEAKGSLLERLSSLGYPEKTGQAIAALAHRQGLTLVAGPTGSGKTTLLRHVFEALASEMPDRSFLSIEDPPEYPMQRIAQILVDENREERGKAYAEAIAGALRADPDYLMIGEVRHKEAAAAALEATLTGHPVWTSIHAGSALQIFARFLSLLQAANFADPLAYLRDPSILSGLIYQRLVPRLCPECSRPLLDVAKEERFKEDIQLIETLRRLKTTGISMQSVRLRGEGCAHCHNLGRSALLVLSEVLSCDATLLEQLASHRVKEAEVYAKGLGSKESWEQALEHIAQGELDPRDAENCLGLVSQSAGTKG